MQSLQEWVGSDQEGVGPLAAVLDQLVAERLDARGR